MILKNLQPSHLFPVLVSIVVEVLCRTRDTWEIRSAARKWRETDSLDSSGIGLDSLDLLGTASLVNEMFLLYETGVEDTLLAKRTFSDWAELIIYSWKRSHNPGIQFYTSGSSGDKKKIYHSLDFLEQEAIEWLSK